MKFLGIDYGTKRIGLATSDGGGSMAFPLTSFKAGPDAMRLISLLAARENAKIIVIGESKNFKGEPNPVMKNIEKFVKDLQVYTTLPVVYEPEFFTSTQAVRQVQDKRGKQIDTIKDIDASAAALLLQSYLDRIKNKAENK